MNAMGDEAWYALPWQDWVGLGFTVIGFPLAIVGLYLTWIQAREAERQAKEAKGAAEAVSAAISSTQEQLRASQLLVLIPQLRWIAQALEESIDGNEVLLTRKHLDNWRWSASNVRGMMNDTLSAEREMMEKIQGSVTLAFAANTALAEGKAPVLAACKRARASIHEVCAELTSWAGNQATTVESEGSK